MEEKSQIWEEIGNLEKMEGEPPRQYLMRFKQTESRIKNVKTEISNFYLAHQFLKKANLEDLTIQNIILTVNLVEENNILKKIQKNYDNIVVEKKEKKAFYGARYRQRSRSIGNRHFRGR